MVEIVGENDPSLLERQPDVANNPHCESWQDISIRIYEVMGNGPV